jgi:predicted amidohydrolase
MPRIACVQMDVKFGDHDTNLTRITDEIFRLGSDNVDIAIFPECSLGGYCIDSEEQRSNLATELDSSEFMVLQSTVDATGITAIFGFAEHTAREFYNTAALFQPNVRPQYYRKTHLPELGYDKFVTPGSDLPVFETPFGKIGMLICFDVRFPEASRILALKGADIIVLPTNWPKGADISADVLCVARAAENKVYVATCNRVGKEKGFEFIGKSKIIDPFGKVIASAGAEEETITADLDFSLSRSKRIVTIPGKHETTIFESRRPELYGPIFNQTEQIGEKTQ